MANTTTSPILGMPVPVPGTDPGPQYAFDLNSCLNVIDQHDHTPGAGNPITPSAMSINSDLNIGSHNLTAVRSTRFTAQGSPLALASDLGCVYVAGVDLYYNDSSGNQIRITASGGIAGTPGSIANLVAPASASYVAGNQTFVFQSNVNQGANIDGASYILRNIPGTFGLTLSPPTLGSNYTITLPTLPGASSFLSIDSSGGMGSSIPLAQGILTSMIADQNVTTAKIADANVTLVKMAANSVDTSQLVNNSVTPAKMSTLNVQQSASSGSFSSTGTTSIVAVTNLSVTITASGLRPILISLAPTNAGGEIRVDSVTNPGVVHVYLYNGASIASDGIVGSNLIGSEVQFNPNMSWQSFPSAGANTYTIKISTPSPTTTISMVNLNLTAVEV